jgi:hypothetical protein
MSVVRRILALAALAALAACGNQTDQGVFLKKVSSGELKKSGQAGAASPEQIAAAVQASLDGTDLPVALAVIEGRNATAILTRIEQNGDYDTWGTPDRRTVTTRGGIVTATRGLGNDLMSSNTGTSLAMISRRKSGSTTRVMRHLDGENKTVELVLDCQYAKAGSKQLTAGELKNVAVTQMTENCSSGATSFSNLYMVDGRGRPLQSRQWLSPTSGYIVIQLLR